MRIMSRQSINSNVLLTAYYVPEYLFCFINIRWSNTKIKREKQKGIIDWYPSREVRNQSWEERKQSVQGCLAREGKARIKPRQSGPCSFPLSLHIHLHFHNQLPNLLLSNLSYKLVEMRFLDAPSKFSNFLWLTERHVVFTVAWLHHAEFLGLIYIVQPKHMLR